MNARQNSSSNTSIFMGLLMGMIVLFVMYYMISGLFTILTWVAPILFILALIINYKVVLSFGSSMMNRIKRNPLFGILFALVAMMAYPFTAAYLFGKALLMKKVDEITQSAAQETQDQYVEYEDVTEDDVLELDDSYAQPKAEPTIQQRSKYEDLID